MNVSILGASTTESGSSFHSEIVLGKNEFLYALFVDLGSWKQFLFKFGCLLIMFRVSQSE